MGCIGNIEALEFFVLNSDRSGPNHDIAYPRSNSVALITGGLAWIGYIFTQAGAFVLGIDSIYGLLLRLGSAFLYGTGVLLFFVSFRRVAFKAALAQCVLNLVALVFYVRGITRLLLIEPDVAGFASNFRYAQILIAMGLALLALCLYRDKRFPLWLSALFFIYACTTAGQILLHALGFPIKATDPFGVTMMVVSELTYSFMLIRVGARQLNEQEAALRIR